MSIQTWQKVMDERYPKGANVTPFDPAETDDPNGDPDAINVIVPRVMVRSERADRPVVEMWEINYTKPIHAWLKSEREHAVRGHVYETSDGRAFWITDHIPPLAEAECARQRADDDLPYHVKPEAEFAWMDEEVG